MQVIMAPLVCIVVSLFPEIDMCSFHFSYVMCTVLSLALLYTSLPHDKVKNHRIAASFITALSQGSSGISSDCLKGCFDGRRGEGWVPVHGVGVVDTVVISCQPKSECQLDVRCWRRYWTGLYITEGKINLMASEGYLRLHVSIIYSWSHFFITAVLQNIPLNLR